MCQGCDGFTATRQPGTGQGREGEKYLTKFGWVTLLRLPALSPETSNPAPLPPFQGYHDHEDFPGCWHVAGKRQTLKKVLTFLQVYKPYVGLMRSKWTVVWGKCCLVKETIFSPEAQSEQCLQNTAFFSILLASNPLTFPFWNT